VSTVYVQITATGGSSPRDAGTAMAVTSRATRGTIGGGTLEHRATAIARQMLRDGQEERSETFALGPSLGQCCGGRVSLRFSRKPVEVDTPLPLPALGSVPSDPAKPLWIWGAGHVGRACVARMAPLPLFDMTWVDDHADRFPSDLPAQVNAVPCADMTRLVAHAPQDAFHLIFTYSHDLDFALCDALLRRGFGWAGVIGSGTKRARFFKRLRAAGLVPDALTCPIGDKALGKHPDQIAHGVAQSLLRLVEGAEDTHAILQKATP